MSGPDRDKNRQIRNLQRNLKICQDLLRENGIQVPPRVMETPVGTRGVIDWDNVDWRLSNRKLSVKLGFSATTISNWRRRLCAPNPRAYYRGKR